MNFKHDFFNLEIDTESKDFNNKLTKLDSLYKRIPISICLFCPKKETVEADCCKHFSPPLYLIEFFNILKEINNLNIDKNILLFSCYESYLNVNIIKSCVLLENNRCKVYGKHPFSCKMYPLYSKLEWEKRLRKVSQEWNIPINDIPMNQQCPNVEAKNNISLKEENNIFKYIANIDVEILNTKIAKDLVYSAKTYLSFDAHYLLFNIGPDKLEEMSDIKALLIKENERFRINNDRKKLDKLEEEVQDLLRDIKNNIFQVDKQ